MKNPMTKDSCEVFVKWVFLAHSISRCEEIYSQLGLILEDGEHVSSQRNASMAWRLNSLILWDCFLNLVAICTSCWPGMMS